MNNNLPVKTEKNAVYRYELRRRRNKAFEHVEYFTHPMDVGQFAAKLSNELTQLSFFVLLLATNKQLIGYAEVARGGVSAAQVTPRETFQHALLANAESIICFRNSPSGNLEPSREDIRFARSIVESGKMIGIPAHDFLVVSEKGFTSLAERGLLPS